MLWGNEKLTGWSITPLPLYKEEVSSLSSGQEIKGVPEFHRGKFIIEQQGDCFVDMSQWGKGAVWVNGKSLGRFWNIGPQQTLYIPCLLYTSKYKIEGVIGELCEIDMPIYRYADVLTLLSEAIVRNGNSITQEAVGLLNQVRVTHGGLKAYQLSDFASVEDFLDKLLEERGHEFYFEGVRRQDLIRHGKFIEAALAKARFAGQPTGKIETKVDGQYKYEKFPLPTHLITEGQGLIIQNPGY